MDRPLISVCGVNLVFSITNFSHQCKGACTIGNPEAEMFNEEDIAVTENHIFIHHTNRAE